MSEDALRQWAESLGQWHLPRWQELPQLELYMDQVLVYLETHLDGLMPPGEKCITAAMINNYVKQGLLPKPVKKKYGRMHVARLIIISLCKQSISLNDIKTGFDFGLWERDGAEVYDDFCHRQEAALTDAGSALLAGEEERRGLMLQLAVTATASGLAVKRLLSQWDTDTHNLKN